MTLKRRFLITTPFATLNALANSYVRLLKLFGNRFSEEWADFQSQEIDKQIRVVEHTTTTGSHVTFALHTPNKTCGYRARSFSVKEPDTLRWLEKYRDSESFFDIGANVGLYSIYFAAISKGSVIAFEPSPMNIANLTKNISLNRFSDKISLTSMPLSDKTQQNYFNLGSLESGAAMSSFGVNYGWDGKSFTPSASFLTLGIKLDDYLLLDVNAKFPNIIKLDVDGIEPLILRGAEKVLSNKALRSILVEVNPHFVANSNEISEILQKFNFKISPDYSGNNQIWEKV